MALAFFIISVVISALAILLVYYKPKMKIALQALFSIFIIVLAVLLVKGISQPIKFKKEIMKREAAAIEQLKVIRKIQVAYKDKYGKYASSFDTLIYFVKKDSFHLERIVQIGNWDQDEMTKEEAMKAEILYDSIHKFAVKDSLFPSNYPIDNIALVPFGNGEKFELAAGEVETGSKIRVKVFEAYVLYDVLLNGLDRQQVINYKDNRYKLTNFEGLKVGSLTEATNNSGNWEK